MPEHETQHRLSPELALGKFIGNFLAKRSDIEREISETREWKQSIKFGSKYNLRREQKIDDLYRLQGEISEWVKFVLQTFLEVHPELLEEYEEQRRRHQSLPDLREEQSEN